MFRTRLLLIFGIGLLLLAVVVFVVYWSRRPVPQGMDLSKGPASPVAQIGKAYRFEVGHCGLLHLVDFDQSYWDVEVSSMTEAEHSRFGVNSDYGTMTLKRGDIALYQSDSGGDATLRRHAGEKDFFGCM